MFWLIVALNYRWATYLFTSPLVYLRIPTKFALRGRLHGLVTRDVTGPKCPVPLSSAALPPRLCGTTAAYINILELRPHSHSKQDFNLVGAVAAFAIDQSWPHSAPKPCKGQYCLQFMDSSQSPHDHSLPCPPQRLPPVPDQRRAILST